MGREGMGGKGREGERRGNEGMDEEGRDMEGRGGKGRGGEERRGGRGREEHNAREVQRGGQMSKITNSEINVFSQDNIEEKLRELLSRLPTSDVGRCTKYFTDLALRTASGSVPLKQVSTIIVLLISFSLHRSNGVEWC